MSEQPSQTKSPARQKRVAPNPVVLWLISWLTPAYLWLVHLTSRWTHVDHAKFKAVADSDKPFILTFWHGRLLMMPFVKLQTSRAFMMLSSTHKDGQYSAHALRRFGLDYARGSANDQRKKDKNKGGATALKMTLRALRKGSNVGITPDGPRGPRFRISDGTVQLARLSGAPIVPVGWATSRGKYVNSWDRFLVAAPFSKGYYVYGDPIKVPRQTGDDFEDIRLRIENELNRVTAQADRLAGRSIIDPAMPQAQTDG